MVAKQPKGAVMATVVCAVDDTTGAEAVEAAVDFSLEHGTDLRLVGVVKDKFTDSSRGTAGERVRRRKAVDAALERAAEVARAAGVPFTTTVRLGRVEKELLAEADAFGSGELFFVRTRGPIRAAVTGAPRREAVHISMGESMVRDLAAAA
jgi:Universal stress protein family